MRLLLGRVACIIIMLYSVYTVTHLNIQSHEYLLSACYRPCVLRSGEARVTKTESVPCPLPVQRVRRQVRGLLQDRDCQGDCLEEVTLELSHETVGALASSGFEVEGLGQRAWGG